MTTTNPPSQPKWGQTLALFLHRPRGCTTTARTDLRTLRLRAEAYDALVARDPTCAAEFRNGVLAHMRRRFGG